MNTKETVNGDRCGEVENGQQNSTEETESQNSTEETESEMVMDVPPENCVPKTVNPSGTEHVKSQMLRSDAAAGRYKPDPILNEVFKTMKDDNITRL